MTSISWRNGPILRSGAIGTGQACCCGGCSGPCSTTTDCAPGCECVDGQCTGSCDGCCGYIPENCRVTLTVVARGTTVTTTYYPQSGGIFDPPIDDPLLPSFLPGTFFFGDCKDLAESSGVAGPLPYRCCCISYEETSIGDVEHRAVGVSYIRCTRCCNSLGEKLGGDCGMSATDYEFVSGDEQTADDVDLATDISFTMVCDDTIPETCPCSSPTATFTFTAPAGFTTIYSGPGGAMWQEDADGRLWTASSYWNECVCKWVVYLNGGCYSQWRAYLSPEGDCQPPAGVVEWFSKYCIPYTTEGRLEDCDPIAVQIVK